YTTAPVTITFSSTCISQGLASVAASGSTSAGSTANTVETTTGTADATYTAKGCSGSDVITASATIGSTNLTATGTVTVASAATGSLEFVSAMPGIIGLKGTGQPSTSTVIFKVLDSTGAPKAGVTVTFSLNTTVGGLSFSPVSATSAADGTVQTVVSSGTVHTPVTVTATIASPALSTQSSSLTVSTGIPASNTFTVAVGPAVYPGQTTTPPACPNVEAWDLEGVNVPITVSLADRYNNPVLDGTAVSFYTDGGKITGSCTTANGTGTCQGTNDTVDWTSENPQPTPDTALPSKSSEPGRVVLLATAIGEESFDDANGSGFYQSGDTFTNLGDPYDNSQELSAPQLYSNSAYVLGDYFLDYKQTGQYAPPPTPPVFVGITCNGTTASSTCTENALAISQSALIIMSTGGAQVVATGATGAFALNGSGQIVTGTGSSGTITFTISSYYGDYSPPTAANPISAGSTVAVTATGVGTLSATSGSFTEGCSTNPAGDQYTIYLTSVPSPPSGYVTFQVTSAGTKTLTTVDIPVN
ncbi:MAG: hypothetical protein WA374_16245, partial [Acidobacteriaceae bacterium]